jgi:hypothetical protein
VEYPNNPHGLMGWDPHMLINSMTATRPSYRDGSRSQQRAVWRLSQGRLVLVCDPLPVHRVGTLPLGLFTILYSQDLTISAIV